MGDVSKLISVAQLSDQGMNVGHRWRQFQIHRDLHVIDDRQQQSCVCPATIIMGEELYNSSLSNEILSEKYLRPRPIYIRVNSQRQIFEALVGIPVKRLRGQKPTLLSGQIVPLQFESHMLHE